MADRWLENLKKGSTVVSRPALAPADKPDVFTDLFKVSDDGSPVSAEKMTKIYEDGIDAGSDFINPIIEQAKDALAKGRNLTADGKHNATAILTSPREELAEIDDAWEELLGGHAIGAEDGSKASKRYEQARAAIDRLFQNHPEEREEALALVRRVAVDTALDTAKAAGGELAKSEVQSRMLKLFNQISDFCQGEEAKLLEKAIKALDFTCFAELAEPILARMRAAA